MLVLPLAALLFLGALALSTGAFVEHRPVGANVSAIEAFIILGAFCFPLSAFLIARAESNRAMIKFSQDWQTTKGKVVESNPTSRLTGHGMTYKLDFACEYFVGGQLFRTERIQFGTARVNSKELSDGFAIKYPVGAQIDVYYDPNDPRDAVIERAADMASDNRKLGLSALPIPFIAAIFMMFKNSF